MKKQDDLLEDYDVLLEICRINGITVYENQPLKNLRGFIYIDTILLKEGLTELEKRAVLTEELTHYFNDTGRVEWRQEMKTRRIMIKENIGLKDVIDAIIDTGEGATFWTVAETLGVPEWLFKEAYEFYSILPYEDMIYRGHLVKFNPIHVWPIEE